MQESALQFIAEINERQDDAIRQIDELNKRIEDLIELCTATSKAESADEENKLANETQSEVQEALEEQKKAA